MCGIAGIISINPHEALGQMLTSIEHRGRDDEGRFFSSPDSSGRIVALGHRRLSVIDTSSLGHQPFLSEDGRYAIVFNGEIYNYRELRLELKDEGAEFKSETDTEVLLHAFRRWGIECLQRLNGMFAFAIWDNSERSLLLARDRAGIKPLYHSVDGSQFVFGSEIKALLASGSVKAQLDHESLSQFLTFLWPVPPKTMFRDVQQLSPGHFLIWKNGNYTISEWWDLDFSKEDSDNDENRWKEELISTFTTSVEMEMVADVPLGSFLSGGIDSSSIVAVMSGITDGVSAYTTGISEKDLEFDIIPDDLKWARRVAERFQLNYHETTLSPDLTELLPKLVRHMDAPVIDMAIPTYLLSMQAREANSVMLSGMGGDEIFGGYPRQMAMKIAGVTDLIPNGIRGPLMRTIAGLSPGGMKGRLTAPLRNAKKFAKSAALGFEDRYLGFGTYFSEQMKDSLLTNETQSAIGECDPYETHRALFAKCKDVSPLNRLLYVDFKTFMPALNLDTTDKMSMAANLEVRVPFLNHKLVSLSERMPASLKIKGLKRKYILKRAAEKWLPKDIVWRKKAGFSAPVRSWMRNELGGMLSELLSERAVKQRGLFNHSYISHMMKMNSSGQEDFNLQLFQLLNLEIWMREFID